MNICDVVWNSLSLEAQRLLLAIGAGLPFVDLIALDELLGRHLAEDEHTLTANGLAVFQGRS